MKSKILRRWELPRYHAQKQAEDRELAQDIADAMLVRGDKNQPNDVRQRKANLSGQPVRNLAVV